MEWRNQQKQSGYFSVNKVFRKTVQNSQKTTCAGVSFLTKFQVLRPAALLTIS